MRGVKSEPCCKILIDRSLVDNRHSFNERETPHRGSGHSGYASVRTPSRAGTASSAGRSYTGSELAALVQQRNAIKAQLHRVDAALAREAAFARTTPAPPARRHHCRAVAATLRSPSAPIARGWAAAGGWRRRPRRRATRTRRCPARCSPAATPSSRRACPAPRTSGRRCRRAVPETRRRRSRPRLGRPAAAHRRRARHGTEAGVVAKVL